MNIEMPEQPTVPYDDGNGRAAERFGVTINGESGRAGPVADSQRRQRTRGQAGAGRSRHLQHQPELHQLADAVRLQFHERGIRRRRSGICITASSGTNPTAPNSRCCMALRTARATGAVTAGRAAS